MVSPLRAPSSQPMRPMRPQAALPKDVNAQARETVIAELAGWRFIGMGNAPLITRKGAGAADSKRKVFLDGIAPLRAGAFLPLDFFAREMGRLWDASLPADFPPGFRPSPPSNTASPDLCATVVVLLRVGLLVVDGIKVDAVTRTDFQPSQLGYLLIRNEEGLAPQIYWPANDNSGVTVGPGYDMGGRSQERIISDLTGVGISAGAAAAAARAARLQGSAAGAFVKLNKQLLTLTPMQQQSLFDLIIPTYVDVVRATTPKSLLSRLFQHEFDAMLSLAWNLRKYGRYGFNGDISRLDMVKADPSIRTLTGGGPGIPGRRVRETTLFTDATYIIKPLMLRNIDVDYDDDVPPSGVSRG